MNAHFAHLLCKAICQRERIIALIAVAVAAVIFAVITDEAVIICRTDAPRSVLLLIR